VARILADENFPQPAVNELQALGHDVRTLLDAGFAGQSLPDDAVLDLALADARVLVTLNRKHFIQLHLTGRAHAGIVVCTVDPDPVALAVHVHTALNAAVGTGFLLRVHRQPRPGS
jgi:hypothetical protein